MSYMTKVLRRADPEGARRGPGGACKSLARRFRIHSEAPEYAGCCLPTSAGHRPSMARTSRASWDQERRRPCRRRSRISARPDDRASSGARRRCEPWDIDGMMTLVTDDIVWETPAPDGQRFEGRQPFAAAQVLQVVPNTHFEAEETIALGDRAVGALAVPLGRPGRQRGSCPGRGRLQDPRRQGMRDPLLRQR